MVDVADHVPEFGFEYVYFGFFLTVQVLDCYEHLSLVITFPE